MAIKRTFADRLRPWVPALLWLVVIACESTGLFSSENTFRWFYSVVRTLLGLVNLHELAIAHAILRKVGHFVGYAILSYFWFIGWRGSFFSKVGVARRQLRELSARMPSWRGSWALYSVLMAAGVASLDEFHQTFLHGRTGTWHDVVLDTAGAVFAQLLVRSVNRESQPKDIKEEQPVA